MIVRSKAPLRLGLAGGGTDVSPYCDIYGGSVLNASINMYAHTSLTLLSGRSSDCAFEAHDIGLQSALQPDQLAGSSALEKLPLHSAVYKRIVSDFLGGEFVPVRVITHCDAPPGSGLGSSSTMVVSMIEAYKQMFALPLGEYDVARLAFDIERNDCDFAGGKQDQYAATFGGFNFMEFYESNRVVVNPLRIRRHIVNELEAWMILFYTGQSRSSGAIIKEQSETLVNNEKSLEAMHEVKSSALYMKEILLKGDIKGVAEVIKEGWYAKKRTASNISNDTIAGIEAAVIGEGACSIKISGAGGGGYMMIFVQPEKRIRVERLLSTLPGVIRSFQFYNEGSMSWTTT
jgi:D-glycero-alpha-D-manno-heptose-7-phosphate kinase